MYIHSSQNQQLLCLTFKFNYFNNVGTGKCVFIRQTVDILTVHTLQMWSSLNAICAALYSV